MLWQAVGGWGDARWGRVETGMGVGKRVAECKAADWRRGRFGLNSEKGICHANTGTVAPYKRPCFELPPARCTLRRN